MSYNYPTSRNDPTDALQADLGQPTKYPVYRCAWRDQTSFSNEERAWIGLGINSMSALGPTFIWVFDGTEDFQVGHWADDNSINPEPQVKNRDGMCRNAEQFTRRTNMPDLIEIDPVGIRGELQWIEASAHGAGHFLAMDHIDPHDHGTHGGPGIMAPDLSGIELSPDITSTDMPGNVPPGGPTRADFAEFDRVNKLGLTPVPRFGRVQGTI